MFEFHFYIAPAVVRKIMAPRNVHVPIPQTWGHGTFNDKRGAYPGFSEWVFIKEREGRMGREVGVIARGWKRTC